MPFMPPGIHHEENKNHEAQNQKDHCPRLSLPELLDAARKVRTHACLYLTPTRQNLK